MKYGPLSRLVTAAAASLTLLFAQPAAADHIPPPDTGEVPPDYVPPQLKAVGVTEHLGAQVPFDVELRDEAGKAVKVGDYFGHGKPVAINFVYHSCPTLCSMVQSGFAASLRELSWTVGQNFEVLTISIDPRDTPAVAAAKKDGFVKGYGRDPVVTARGWHFLTGDASETKRLAEALGFSYYYDYATKQFAHSAALFVLTPSGSMARYLYGIEFPAKDMRLALTEAAEGRASNAVDHLLLYCYRYDPNSRGYVLVAWKVMRLGAGGCAILLGGLVAFLWYRERRRAPAPAAPGPLPPLPASPLEASAEDPSPKERLHPNVKDRLA